METKLSIIKLITKSNIVYYNGKTVKDKNFNPEYDFNLKMSDLENKVKVDFWDEKNQILSLKSRY
jgi:hypothetical protein